jgi:hypothetical protein
MLIDDAFWMMLAYGASATGESRRSNAFALPHATCLQVTCTDPMAARKDVFRSFGASALDSGKEVRRKHRSGCIVLLYVSSCGVRFSRRLQPANCAPADASRVR